MFLGYSRCYQISLRGGNDTVRFRVNVIVLIAFFLFSLSAQASESVVLCVGDAPPYIGRDLPDGGPLLEVVREAFARQKILTTVVFAPWARLIKMGEAGGCVMVGLWRNAHRDEIFTYSSGPVVIQKLGLYKRKNMVISHEKMVVGVERGSYISPYVLAQPWRRVENTIQLQNLRLLKAGRIDLVYGDLGTLDHLLAGEPELAEGVEFPATVIEEKPAYLAAAKSIPGVGLLMDSFNQGMMGVREDGSYKEIMEKSGAAVN